ncbi:hypothetical protein [Nonomuraea polychroma]|uniref:hypothetical protein n=1 Tax=Nonomuraea polychroma TaxID=46176 RepID=UPI000FDE9EDA|nr:hypothetical protein [Nonomuraea polychroma]
MWRYIAAGGAVALTTKARVAAIGDGALPTQVGVMIHVHASLRAGRRDRRRRLAVGRRDAPAG